MRIKWFSVIRMIGLLFVLSYHFFIKVFSGGFVGVDLFFTLSGYLTTALLIDEFARTEKIDLKKFFRRRFYRILPPLLLTILLVLPLALLVRNDFIAHIGSQVTAAIGFMTNFFEIFSGGSYENQFTPHLFVHTWTLAIEVHFYLLWGLLLWYFSRIAKTIGQLRGMIFLSSGLLFILSFLGMFVSSFFVTNYSTIYYSSFTHIFPFFIGSLLATMAGITQTTSFFQTIVNKWSKKQTLSTFLVGLIVEIFLLFTLNFNSIFTYLVGLLLSSLATATMIFSARILHEKTADITEPSFLDYIANISYGVYLFHWPLYIIFSQLLSSIWAVAFTIIFSLIAATASYYILEPYLVGKTGQLFGLTIDLAPYKRYLITGFSLLVACSLGIAVFAPKLGNFEKESLVSNLYQAQTQLATTRAAAENAQATSYDIQKGVTIFGDSVTVRASADIQAVLPEAQIDGTVSRHLTEITGLVNLYKQNNTLKETVVVALGTNTSENYKELLDDFISHFPKGHRLVFVTPYDGNYAPSDSLTYQTGQYEKELTKQYDFISIADWYHVARSNPHIWYDTDLVHYNIEANGGEVFAQTIQKAVEAAQQSPIKN